MYFSIINVSLSNISRNSQKNILRIVTRKKEKCHIAISSVFTILSGYLTMYQSESLAWHLAWIYISFHSIMQSESPLNAAKVGPFGDYRHPNWARPPVRYSTEEQNPPSTSVTPTLNARALCRWGQSDSGDGARLWWKPSQCSQSGTLWWFGSYWIIAIPIGQGCWLRYSTRENPPSTLSPDPECESSVQLKLARFRAWRQAILH